MSKTSAEGGAARRVFGFVKTTLVGGLIFVGPVLVMLFVLVKLAPLLRRLARPLSAILPVDTLLGLIVADVIAIALLILGCFLAGLLARVSFANRFVKKAEASVLWRIPGYGLIRALTESLDKNIDASMRPVLVHFDDYAQLVFEVDRLPDGRSVVYVPSAPYPRAGSVLVVDQSRIEAVPMTFVGAMGSLRALGRGVGRFLERAPNGPDIAR